MHSLAERFAEIPKPERDAILAEFSDEQLAALEYDWEFWGRPNQIEPGGDWSTWFVNAGRGFGKTRLGSEWIRANVCGRSPMAKGRYSRVALVAETAADARDVLAEGPSGILAVHPPDFRPHYEPSKRRLTWPSGATATLYNGTEPDQLRGPEHDLAWLDELAKYRYAEALWDMLQFGLRVGHHPKALVTTTPRPIKIIREIMEDPTTEVTHGRTLDNAKNLPTRFVERIIKKYQGTRLGRQELDAEILDEVFGALWTSAALDACRVDTAPRMQRIVVAIDPSGSDGKNDDADAIGIVVAGKGADGKGYVLADLTCHMSPEGWAGVAVRAFDDFGADTIVAERNFGGDMVRAVIQGYRRTVPVKLVTASRGKQQRAEPVSMLYEKTPSEVYHVRGDAGSGRDHLEMLEKEMRNMTRDGYLDDGSPNRVDALVWAITELMVTGSSYTLEGVY